MTYIGSLMGGSSNTSSSGSAISFAPGQGISGLASGINTDAIVQGYMQMAYEPLIQLLQQRQITLWKQESYQRVNNTLTDLQSNLSSLQLQSTFLQNATSSSNSSLVSASASTLSPNGSYSVTVQQLASGVTLASTSTLSTDPNYANTPINQLSPNPLGLSSSSTAPLTFTLNGQTFTVNPATDTINSILQEISSNTAAGVSGFYDPNTGRVVLQTTSTGSGALIEVSNDTSGIFSKLFGLQAVDPMTLNPTMSPSGGIAGGVVNINGVTFSFASGESLQTVAAQITAQSAKTGVTATYNGSTLTLSGAETASQTLDVSQMPSAGDVLTIAGTQITFYNSAQGQSAPSSGIGIDLSTANTPAALASAIANAVNSNSSLSSILTATVAPNGTQVILNANTTGSAGNFATSYQPVNGGVIVGAETLGTSSTPTTDTITFNSVPSAGDILYVAGQEIEFYDSSKGPAPSGSNITAVDIHGQTTSTIASAVASALTGATGTANGNQLTITAKSNGATSLGVDYVYANAPITGTGVTNASNITLYSGISVTDPTNYQDQSTVLGVPSSYASAAQADGLQLAQNAYYTINGYASSSPTNQVTFNNTTFSLNGVTSTPVNVTVSTNVNAIVQAITNFVQQYNETLQYMQIQYNTIRNYDYLPLTAAQAQQMTSDQVAEWTQEAQAGMLENDPLLGSVMNNLKNTISTVLPSQGTANINGVPTEINSLASIGITPIDPLTGVSSGAIAPGVTTTGWNTYGLLQINTAQLQAAVEANPQAVMNLFTGSGSSSSGSSSTSGVNPTEGIAKQLYSVVTNSINMIRQQAGTGDTYDPTSPTNSTTSNSSSSSNTSNLLAYTLIDPTADLSTLFSQDAYNTSFLGQQVETMDQQALAMDQQLQELQQRYEQEFSNMESQIAAINTQSAYISSMMGGGSSSGG